MFDCRACISRCIRTLFSDALQNTSQLASLHPSVAACNSRHADLRRDYHATARLFRTGHHTVPNLRTLRHQTNQAIPRKDDHPEPSSSSTNPRQTDRVALAKHDRTTKQRDPNQASGEKKTRELKQELTYLEDPLKLAENTVKLLRKDDHEKALDIVRMATKRTSCVVSWNHIIDYQMSKGKIHPAEKIYNEVPIPSMPICLISADTCCR